MNIADVLIISTIVIFLLSFVGLWILKRSRREIVHVDASWLRGLPIASAAMMARGERSGTIIFPGNIETSSRGEDRKPLTADDWLREFSNGFSRKRKAVAMDGSVPRTTLNIPMPKDAKVPGSIQAASWPFA